MEMKQRASKVTGPRGIVSLLPEYQDARPAIITPTKKTMSHQRINQKEDKGEKKKKRNGRQKETTAEDPTTTTDTMEGNKKRKGRTTMKEKEKSQDDFYAQDIKIYWAAAGAAAALAALRASTRLMRPALSISITLVSLTPAIQNKDVRLSFFFFFF